MQCFYKSLRKCLYQSAGLYVYVFHLRNWMVGAGCWVLGVSTNCYLTDLVWFVPALCNTALRKTPNESEEFIENRQSHKTLIFVGTWKLRPRWNAVLAVTDQALGAQHGVSAATVRTRVFCCCQLRRHYPELVAVAFSRILPNSPFPWHVSFPLICVHCYTGRVTKPPHCP